MSSVPPVGPAAALLLQTGTDLAARLVLGQIVRAQVLEQQEGNRYLMRILGQTTLAESALPLKAGDVFQGRVVGLQDRVQLERVEVHDIQQDVDVSQHVGASRAAELIEDLFRRYRATLDPRDATALERLVARAARPERMALAGLILRKLGLALDAGLLESLAETLARPALAPIGGAVEIEINEENSTQEIDDSMRPAPAQWPAAQRVLNAQGGGSVAHQLGVLPLVFDGRVVEVELALFEEGEGRHQDTLRHRKLVVAFDTERLGRVQARALTAGDHIRVALGTETSAATNSLLRYGESLSRALAGAGWQVDELSHETRARPETSATVSAAVEHLITPGSINRVL